MNTHQLHISTKSCLNMKNKNKTKINRKCYFINDQNIHFSMWKMETKGKGKIIPMYQCLTYKNKQLLCDNYDF